jgi:hypothetical protein
MSNMVNLVKRTKYYAEYNKKCMHGLSHCIKCCPKCVSDPFNDLDDYDKENLVGK